MYMINYHLAHYIIKLRTLQPLEMAVQKMLGHRDKDNGPQILEYWFKVKDCDLSLSHLQAALICI